MKRWTQEEDNLLKQYYQKYGGKYCINLIDRTYGAIYERVKKLGLARMIKRWTPDEETVLQKHYPNYGVEYCSELLNKSCRAISKKVFRLNVKPNRGWSSDEDNVLIDYYIKHGDEYCFHLLNRPIKTISARARKLGLLSNITNGGFPKKQIIKKLSDNKVIALCQKHRETPHYFRNKSIQHCVKCASIKDVNYKKKERLTPLGLYKSRLRNLLNSAFGRYSRINGVKKSKGCFRHLSYSPQQLCDHLEGVKEQQKNTCPICRQSYSRVKLSIDHIVPLKTAETEEGILELFNLSNLSLLCLSCNSSKGARMGVVGCR